MLLKNKSLNIWGFDYLININGKLLFVKSFYIVYVLKLIENGLSLFWDDLEAMRDNSIEFQNYVQFASNDQFCV